jgi:hypothetical protein
MPDRQTFRRPARTSCYTHESAAVPAADESSWPAVKAKEIGAVTDQERPKAEELISNLELAVGQIFPRDSSNASLIATMIQSLNGLRSLLNLVRPH